MCVNEKREYNFHDNYIIFQKIIVSERIFDAMRVFWGANEKNFESSALLRCAARVTTGSGEKLGFFCVS